MTEKVCILIKVNLLARDEIVGTETEPGANRGSANSNQVRVEAHANPSVFR